MKKITKFVLALLTAQIAATAALADDDGYGLKAGGLFVEPILSYEQHNSTLKNPIGANSTGNFSGYGLGGRLGFHIDEVFFVGADARYSFLDWKNSAVNSSASAKAYNYGITAGVQMPYYGLRVWGTYVIGGELDPDKVSNVDGRFKEGSGYRVGAGIKLNIVSLNLEYQDLTYKKTVIEGLGPLNTNIDYGTNAYNTRGFIASVSFPLAL